MSPPLVVKVMVSVRGREVPLDQVRDPSVVRAFRQLGSDVGLKLGQIRCPEHRRGATNVRLFVDQNGGADLRYDSCCTKLRDAIGKALG
jgi:hypothetical protein